MTESNPPDKNLPLDKVKHVIALVCAVNFYIGYELSIFQINKDLS